MCVLIGVPAGVKTPSYETLLACSKANPDGQGFATPRKLYKNLDFETFYDELCKVGDNVPRIIHFRFATEGSVCRRNCHPFKKGGIAFAHNGCLPIRPVGDRTDSEQAFLDYIYPVAKRHGIMSQETLQAVSRIIGTSKFAMMQRGEMRLFGHFSHVDGAWYSNLRWQCYLPRTIRQNAYEAWAGWYR